MFFPSDSLDVLAAFIKKRISISVTWDITFLTHWFSIYWKVGLPRWQMVKHPPAVQETWVQSLRQEDPLEKEMATHSSTLAWKIPWTEEPGRLQSMGLQRVEHDWATSRSVLRIFPLFCPWSIYLCLSVTPLIVDGPYGESSEAITW